MRMTRDETSWSSGRLGFLRLRMVMSGEAVHLLSKDSGSRCPFCKNGDRFVLGVVPVLSYCLVSDHGVRVGWCYCDENKAMVEK